MTKASDNEYPSVLFDEQAGDPSTPASGFWRAYFKSTGLFIIDDGGSVTGPLGGGSVSSEVDYVAFTSPVSITATSEATANTVVTSSAIAYSGSDVVVIEFVCPAVQTNDGTDVAVFLWLYDGSSSIGRLGTVGHGSPDGTLGVIASVHASHRLTPSAATHTYSIRASLLVAGTGTAGAGAGGTGNVLPGYIRIFTA